MWLNARILKPETGELSSNHVMKSFSLMFLCSQMQKLCAAPESYVQKRWFKTNVLTVWSYISLIFLPWSEQSNKLFLFQAGGNREVVGSFINLQVLQKSQFDYCRVSSTLRVLLLVSLAVCPPEAPCWGDSSTCQSWMGKEGLGVRGMCSWSIQRTHAQSLGWIRWTPIIKITWAKWECWRSYFLSPPAVPLKSSFCIISLIF